MESTIGIGVIGYMGTWAIGVRGKAGKAQAPYTSYVYIRRKPLTT